MEGCVFCPLCFTPLSRSPRDKSFFSNGRSAHFKHLPSYEVSCPNRSVRSQGLKFDTEEDARRAIENDQLAVIHGFLQERPEARDEAKGSYDQSAVEDEDGPVSPYPISRYRGQNFHLPSKFTSVRGICRGFDRNYEKYFILPERIYPQRLREIIKPVLSLNETNATPSLYYGRVENVSSFYKGPGYTRMVQLRYSSDGEFADFFFKQSNSSCEEHGVNASAIGRVIIMYGSIKISGVGLCIQHVAWGEFALLPQQYEYLLD